MEEKINNLSSVQNHETNEYPKKKITIVVDEDDPCLNNRTDKPEKESKEFLKFLGNDPRFQQTDQTCRCFVMYTDFYRCEHILGENHEACVWFKNVFTSICPNDWVRRWDELRLTGRLPWHKYKTQGDFPGYKYGE